MTANSQGLRFESHSRALVHKSTKANAQQTSTHMKEDTLHAYRGRRILAPQHRAREQPDHLHRNVQPDTKPLSGRTPAADRSDQAKPDKEPCLPPRQGMQNLPRTRCQQPNPSLPDNKSQALPHTAARRSESRCSRRQPGTRFRPRPPWTRLHLYNNGQGKPHKALPKPRHRQQNSLAELELRCPSQTPLDRRNLAEPCTLQAASHRRGRTFREGTKHHSSRSFPEEKRLRLVSQQQKLVS